MSKFSLQPEDGTIQNGDIRGNDSSDLQVARDSASQIASGYASVLVGGFGNTASGTYSAAFGGYNVSSGEASLAIGLYTTAQGDYSLSGGFASQALATSSASLGFECITTGVQSTLLFAVNGFTEPTGVGSLGMGTDVRTYLPLQVAFAGGQFTVRGDAQNSTYLAKGAVFNQGGGAPIVLVIGKGTTTPLIIDGLNRSWSVVVDYQVVCNDGGLNSGLTGQVYKVQKSFFFKVVNGVTSLSAVDSFNEQFDTDMSTCTFNVSAAASNSLALVGTTPLTANTSDFRAIARVEITEIAW